MATNLHLHAISESMVSAKELGALFGLSQRSIQNNASKGHIPGYKVNGSWRFAVSEVIEACRTKTRPQ